VLDWAYQNIITIEARLLTSAIAGNSRTKTSAKYIFENFATTVILGWGVDGANQCSGHGEPRPTGVSCLVSIHDIRDNRAKMAAPFVSEEPMLIQRQRKCHSFATQVGQLLVVDL
jgi:hypothetical protein